MNRAAADRLLPSADSLVSSVGGIGACARSLPWPVGHSPRARRVGAFVYVRRRDGGTMTLFGKTLAFGSRGSECVVATLATAG
jgi:hypothetical protein